MAQTTADSTYFGTIIQDPPPNHSQHIRCEKKKTSAGDVRPILGQSLPNGHARGVKQASLTLPSTAPACRPETATVLAGFHLACPSRPILRVPPGRSPDTYPKRPMSSLIWTPVEQDIDGTGNPHSAISQKQYPSNAAHAVSDGVDLKPSFGLQRQLTRIGEQSDSDSEISTHPNKYPIEIEDHFSVSCRYAPHGSRSGPKIKQRTENVYNQYTGQTERQIQTIKYFQKELVRICHCGRYDDMEGALQAGRTNDCNGYEIHYSQKCKWKAYEDFKTKKRVLIRLCKCYKP